MGQNPEEGELRTSLVDALLVYAEPLAQGAHAVVIGDSASSVAERLVESGARSVSVFDPDPARAASTARSVPRGVTVKPFIDELDVRDGAFDLAIIPDLADLNDPHGAVSRLRSAIARNGALVALGRARNEEAPRVFEGKLGQAALSYDELYDLFASQFDDVTLTGVLPFAGVVFAQLGIEDPAVSVETRLVQQDPPSVFVVVAGDDRERRPELDPYAIVQIDEAAASSRSADRALEATAAAQQLKAEILATQLDEMKQRLVASDVRALEVASAVERAVLERDAALTRAMELEAVLAAAQQTLATMERTILEAERGMLDRDDRLAILSAEIDARDSASGGLAVVMLRAERAEAALSIAQDELSSRLNPAALERAENVEQELAAIAEAHALETAGFESQLRDRARFIAALEKELVRREQLVKELVASIEEMNAGAHVPPVFEAAAPLPERSDREVRALQQKLDALAQEVARREGELTARGWRIAELENQLRSTVTAPEPAPSKLVAADADASTSTTEAALRDELDALRAALAQEHAARAAAESGEELTQARAELAKQAALLEQIRAQRGSS